MTVSTSAPNSTSNQALDEGDIILLRPLNDFTSLEAAVNINARGLLNGKRSQEDLTGLLTTNAQKKTRIEASGSLLGDVLAPVDGSAARLFSPSRIQIFKMPEGTFVVVKGLREFCFRPKPSGATAMLELLEPHNVMNLLARSDVGRGNFVGIETINRIRTRHYLIDGNAFLTAARNSSNVTVQTLGSSLASTRDADLYVAVEGSYPVAFRGSYAGEIEPIKFRGDLELRIDLIAMNLNPTITLPPSCRNVA